jgi:hypothetical protein
MVLSPRKMMHDAVLGKSFPLRQRELFSESQQTFSNGASSREISLRSGASMNTFAKKIDQAIVFFFQTCLNIRPKSKIVKRLLLLAVQTHLQRSVAFLTEIAADWLEILIEIQNHVKVSRCNFFRQFLSGKSQEVDILRGYKYYAINMGVLVDVDLLLVCANDDFFPGELFFKFFEYFLGCAKMI